MPAPLRPSFISYFKALEKARHRKFTETKLLWLKDNAFKPKKTLFRNGSAKEHKIIAEASQKQIHMDEYDQKLVYVRAQLASDELSVQELKKQAQTALDQHFNLSIALAREWGPVHDPTPGMQLKRDRAIQQVVEAVRAISDNADKKFDRWKFQYDKKQSREVIRLHKKEVLAEALNEEYQREREFDDQLADLRVVMKHMSSTFDTKSPKNRRGGGSHGSKSASQSRSQSRSPRGSSKSRSSRSSSRSSMSSTRSHLSRKSRNSSRSSRSSHGSHKSVTVVSPRSPHKRHAQQDTRPRSRRRVK